MSVQAMTWAFDQNVPPKPKMVLMALANRADNVTGKCWPGIDTIARESSVPRRSLFRVLAALERNGYVMIERTRGPKGQQCVNVYYLRLDRVADEWGAWHWLAAGDDDGAEAASEDESDGMPDAEPGAKLAPGQVTETAAPAPVHNPSATPGAGCQNARVPGAIGGTREESSERTQREPKGKLTDSESMTPAAGFSRKDRDAAIEADRIARAAAKARVSIFVFEGSDAWQAWIAHRKRTTGIASMPKTWATIDGKRRLGWWCPSLYPPRDAPSPGERSPEAMAQNRETGPPGGIGLASAEDVAELARGG